MAAGAGVGARVAGLPGAVAGAAGGALVSGAPGIINFGRKLDEYDPTGLGKKIDDYYFGHGTSSAPVPPPSGSGQTQGSVPVHITNPGDLTHGLGQGLASGMNKPQSGITGIDPKTSDYNHAYMGANPF